MNKELENKSTPTKPARRPRLSADEYVQGVLEQNRAIMAQVITLVESNLAKHRELNQEVIHRLLPYTGKSIRIGITGVPGAGKSTFIEAFGSLLCEHGSRIAVLAIDPSSTRTGGSILGDKTRMERLARHPNAYIRPSASGGFLGGVTRKTRETILICEAAGYDVILVETVGVGQNEVTVRTMVDFFLLLQITGAGDELQGLKKGVVELADLILINKADGANKQRAERMKEEYNQILHYLQPATEGWSTKAYTCSATTEEGIAEIWQITQEFQQLTMAKGVFQERRRQQELEWMKTIISEYVLTSFYSHPEVSQFKSNIEQSVQKGELSATMAAKKLIDIYQKSIKSGLD